MQPTYPMLRIAQGVALTLLLALVVHAWPAFPVLLTGAGLGWLVFRLDRSARRSLWNAALEDFRGLVVQGASADELREAYRHALDLTPSDSVERLVTELELDRYRVLEGDLDPEFERELAGRLGMARQVFGPGDVNYARAAQSLGRFFWFRARACLEHGGLEGIHHPDRSYRIGLNIQRYFQEDEFEFSEEAEEPSGSRAAYLASVCFHWRDLYQAEQYLEEARECFRKVLGEDHPDTALAGADLAQVLAVNQDPDRAVEVAGRSLATLSTHDGPESQMLAPAYEALGMAYHFEGHEAEASIYLARSDQLSGLELPPRPPEGSGLPLVETEPEGTIVRLHVPEDADPLIH